MIEIIIVLVTLVLGYFTIMKTPTITPTPTPKVEKRVRFNLSHAQTNHATSELMRQKAELSRNNFPGNELIRIPQFNWAPSINS